jgi:hypothetical protein
MMPPCLYLKPAIPIDHEATVSDKACTIVVKTAGMDCPWIENLHKASPVRPDVPEQRQLREMLSLCFPP